MSTSALSLLNRDLGRLNPYQNICFNPTLYRAVINALTDGGRSPVEIVNKGEKLNGYYSYSAYNPEVESFTVRDWGELYRVNCPFCNDTRGRCFISYMFGTYDLYTSKRHTNLWKCHNEECQKDYLNTMSMANILDSHGIERTPTLHTLPNIVDEPDLSTASYYPGTLYDIASLPEYHSAVKYLRDDRGMDIDELSSIWGVKYGKSTEEYHNHKIVAPVTYNGEYVGYQTRYIGNRPKVDGVRVLNYVTHYRKSRYLYGTDQARGYGKVVIVEGFMDVWRYGRGALGTLGTISLKQIAVLVKEFPESDVVFVPDTDEIDKKTKTLNVYAAKERLLPAIRVLDADRSWKGKIGIADLPPNSDPASMSRSDLHQIVDTTICRRG